MRQRLVVFLSETPFLFFAIVLGVGLVFKLAIGWAKTPTTLAEDPAARPLSSSAAAATQPTTATVPLPGGSTTSTPALATPEPVPSVPAPAMGTRKKPRPRR